MKKLILCVSLVMTGAQASATANSCHAIFGTERDGEFSVVGMDTALESIESVNAKQDSIAKLTRGTLGRATELVDTMEIKQLNFNIQQTGNPIEVVRGMQTLSIEMTVAYMRIKIIEPRVLALRAKGHHRTDAEHFELMNLEAQRALALRLAPKFKGYDRKMKELEKYATDPELAAYKDKAAQAIQYLGITEGWLKQNPSLLAYVTKHAAPGRSAESYLRPSRKELHALFMGYDPHLSETERLIGLNAILDRDIRVQRLDNYFRKALEIASDQTIIRSIQVILSKIGRGNLSADAVREITEKFNHDLNDSRIVATHYPGVEEVIGSKATTEDKFRLFMNLNAIFGSSKDGVPNFMVTLARRGQDSIVVWNELKKFIEETHADFVMGPNLTLLQSMARAEEARALGLLPSVLDPRGTVSYKAFVTNLAVAGLAVFTFNYLADKLHSGDDKDKDKDDPKATPAPVPAPAPAPVVPAAAPVVPGQLQQQVPPVPQVKTPAPAQPAEAKPAAAGGSSDKDEEDEDRPLPPRGASRPGTTLPHYN